ncbi:MAG: 2-amino-4-hydroxy-6-hydroxymethyldihydropteridine diphosphokinase [Opitutaceae bacterium]|nr:2-amino-4-hydroxy-6-hydroxymethyldihydropteridine diphosphokinase [Opitutaceae bacterium]
MQAATRQALIGVGANLGDRWATIRQAVTALAQARGILTVDLSPVYETTPVGVTDQPMFLNLVVGVETSLTPEELLCLLRRCERAAGRIRGVRWGPRTLDLDLLVYEGETRDAPGLKLPHPRIMERPFVTVPLRDLLTTAGRYQRPEWDGLRRLLKPLPTGPGVMSWTPPS